MRFVFETRVRAPQAAVFAFHQDPANLAVLHAGQPGFRLLKHTQQPVCVAWFRQRVLGVLPIVLGFCRTLYEPPFRFAEELVHGPFLCFRHEHQFEAAGAETVARDILDYELPWQYGGAVARRAFVEPTMRRVFGFRHRALARLAAEGRFAAEDASWPQRLASCS